MILYRLGPLGGRLDTKQRRKVGGKLVVVQGEGESEEEEEEYEEEEFYSGHPFSAPHCLLYTSVLLGSTGMVLATVCYPATWILVLLHVLN